MAAANTDFFTKVGSPGTATTLAAPGHTIGGTSITVVATTNWPTTTGVIFAIDTFTTVNGVEVRDVGSYTEWEGTVVSSTSITNLVLRYGTDQNYSAGANTRVYIPVSSSRENRFVDGMLVEHGQDGKHTAVTATSIVATNGTFTNLTVSGTAGVDGYTPLGATPNTITALGNRSYSMVFNSTNLTTSVSSGMRLKMTRTVTAPTGSITLNGTTQYANKTSPAGMTFTNNFVVSAWVKMSSYSGNDVGIVSKYNGTSGWILFINTSGQVNLSGYNGGGGNRFSSISNQSIPLNKWVHVAAQLDMTTTSTGTTNNYIMIDGVEVPNTATRLGTNPTALIQAGNLEIGSFNGGGSSFFPGKIAQAAIYNAKVTQANVLATMSQTLTGSETSLISAYKLDQASGLTDLNANGNNLTAQGSPTYSTTDTPFTQDVTNTSVTAGTTNYAIVQKASFSTNTTLTVQVPEGDTIPTTGGVSAVSYSTQKTPYGFPGQKGKWVIGTYVKAQVSQSGATQNTWYNLGLQLTVPVGDWDLGYKTNTVLTQTASSTVPIVQTTLSTANNTESDNYYSSSLGLNAGASNGEIEGPTSISFPLSSPLAAATPYYLNIRTTSSGGPTIYVGGDGQSTVIYAHNGNL